LFNGSSLFSREIVNLAGMEDSNVYHSTSNTEGDVKSCGRVDHQKEDYSVGFAGTVITLAVNMTVSFQS